MPAGIVIVPALAKNTKAVTPTKKEKRTLNEELVNDNFMKIKIQK